MRLIANQGLEELSRNQAKSIPFFYQFWILFFPIASYYFYQYADVEIDRLGKAIYFVALPVTIIMTFSELIIPKYKFSLFAGYVRGILLIMIFSMLMAYFFWGQSLLLSYRATAVSMAIIYYFFLRMIKPNIEYLENIIWILCILYLLVWGYGMFKAPEVVFGIESEDINNDSRGFFRLLIPGNGIIILSFFLAIVKYVETRKKKWIIIIPLLFLFIVMHVIRQVIFLSFLIGLYYLLTKNKYLWLWLILAIIFLLNITQIDINKESAVGKMIELSEDQLNQQQSGEEDIRITAYRYFFTKYSKNVLTSIFGNGIPHSESAFGKMEADLAKNKKLFKTDVGYAYIYISYGIIGLILYGLIFFRVLKQRVSPKYMYAKLFCIYLIFANIAASWVLNDTIIICFCLYILDYNYSEQKEEYSLAMKSDKIIFNYS